MKVYSSDAKYIIETDNYDVFDHGTYSNIYKLDDDTCFKVFKHENIHKPEPIILLKYLKLKNFYKIIDLLYDRNFIYSGYIMDFHKKDNYDILQDKELLVDSVNNINDGINELTKNFIQITNELNKSVKLLRERKNKDQNFKMKIFKFIPTFITGPFIQIVSYLSSIGVRIDAVGLKRFEFGSCVITSLGKLDIDNSFAPIPPLTFAPILLTLCSKFSVNKKDEEGNIETKTYLRMNFTSDYRFFEPKIVSSIIKDIHLIGEDPIKFEEEAKKYEKNVN